MIEVMLYRWVVSRERLMSLLSPMVVLSSRTNNPSLRVIQVEVIEGRVGLTASDARVLLRVELDGLEPYEESLTVLPLTPLELELKVSPQYMSEVLAWHQQPVLTVDIYEPMHPIVLKGGDQFALVMPMRYDRDEKSAIASDG